MDDLIKELSGDYTADEHGVTDFEDMAEAMQHTGEPSTESAGNNVILYHDVLDVHYLVRSMVRIDTVLDHLVAYGDDYTAKLLNITHADIAAVRAHCKVRARECKVHD